MSASPAFSDSIVMPPAAHAQETFVDDEYLLDKRPAGNVGLICCRAKVSIPI